MEHGKHMKLGGSLQVPNVQQLAKEKPNQVPPRYVRFNEGESILSNVSSLPGIPIIDLQKLYDQGAVMELRDFHHACQHWGFFQVINHGVDNSVIENMKREMQEFFTLSLEEKTKFKQLPGDLDGYGQAFVLSEEQKLDWADMFYVSIQPTYLRRPHILPNLPQAFRDAIEAYSAELKTVAMKILYSMAQALDMEKQDMDVLFEEGVQGMRMNYYPPCPQPDLVTGLCAHSDAIGLTILLQVNEVEGLQIKKDGVWVPVVPLPNAFIVNVGDILEIVTNGTYRSIEHRGTTNRDKERLSIATFLSPNLDRDFGPAPTLVTQETPAKFKTIRVAEYFKKFYSRELDGKLFLDAMRI